MIAIHADPNGPKNTRATPENWEKLVALVSKADQLGHKLTLLLSSDWAEMIQQVPNRKTVFKGWVSNGHHAGYHHHTCGHASPDGYRDVPDNVCNGADDRGSVAVAFDAVKALEASVDIAAQGPNTNGIYRAAEWQAEAIYATGEMADNGDGHNHRFITRPRCATDYGNSYSGSHVTYNVAEMGHSQLDVGSFTTIQNKNNLATLETEVDLALEKGHAEAGVHIGVVFHAREYTEKPRTVKRDGFDNDKAYIDAVMQLFADKGVSVVTAREILMAADPCGD